MVKYASSWELYTSRLKTTRALGGRVSSSRILINQNSSIRESVGIQNRSDHSRRRIRSREDAHSTIRNLNLVGCRTSTIAIKVLQPNIDGQSRAERECEDRESKKHVNFKSV